MSSKTEAITSLVSNPVNRREFAKRTMATGLWAAVGAAVVGQSTPASAQSLTDADILNFALNLEYLEAEFYTVATTGRRIEDLGIGVGGVGTLGGTVGGSVVSMESRVAQVARDLANEEQMHVRFLRSALGSAAIAKPAINLAALGIGFANMNEFLILSRAFEDVGVTAYNGAAPLISSKAILAAAAAIGLTEAQHAGELRYLVTTAALPCRSSIIWTCRRSRHRTAGRTTSLTRASAGAQAEPVSLSSTAMASGCFEMRLLPRRLQRRHRNGLSHFRGGGQRSARPPISRYMCAKEDPWTAPGEFMADPYSLSSDRTLGRTPRPTSSVTAIKATPASPDPLLQDHQWPIMIFRRKPDCRRRAGDAL